jgi:exonuclease III
MIIANWNIERLRHIKQVSLIIEKCEEKAADIFVLTETDSRLKLQYKSCFKTHAPTETGVKYRNSEYRVAIYTNYDMIARHPTFDEQTAVCVELKTEYGNLIVYGVVIGIYGNRNENYKIDLPRVLADIERLVADGKPLCVCGDYNCSFSDSYYYTKDSRLAFEESFKKSNLELLTRNQPECIDHIAISCEFLGERGVRVEEWNLDKKLSDHKGIMVEL